MAPSDYEQVLRNVVRMDPAKVLGAAANRIRALAESEDPAADHQLRAWLDAFPIVHDALRARMRAARTLPGFEEARQQFARSQARRASTVQRFDRAVRDGSSSDRLRWSWAVRGYARAVVRFLNALELDARLRETRTALEGSAEAPGWSPISPLQDEAEAPYRRQLAAPASPEAAVHAGRRALVWTAERRAAAAEFDRQAAERDDLLAQACRLAKDTNDQLPSMPSDLAKQISVLRRWLREMEWEQQAALTRSDGERIRSGLEALRELSGSGSLPGAAEWLKRSLGTRR